MNNHDIIIVFTHVPDMDVAKRMAQGLLNAKLAACVNISSATQSYYEWQGQLESATEFMLSVKTQKSLYAQVAQWLLAEHPYELPDILSFNVVDGLPAYMAWVHAQTKPTV